MHGMHELREHARLSARLPAPPRAERAPEPPLAEVAADWMRRSGRVRGVAADDLGIPLPAMTKLLSGAPQRNEATLRRLIAALDRLDGIEDALHDAVRSAVGKGIKTAARPSSATRLPSG